MNASGSMLVPDSWSVVALESIVDVSYGKALAAGMRSGGEIPVVGSSGIVGRHNQALVDDSCLVVGRKGAAGAVHLVTQASWPIDTVYFIQPPTGVDLRYLYYFLSSQSLGELDKSTAIPSLSRDDLYKVEVPIAPMPEQARIVEKLEELLSDLDAGVAELKTAQRKLGQYRQSLLKAAAEGALTADWRATHGIPQESAADVLQRILIERRTAWEHKQLIRFTEQGRSPPKGWQAKYSSPVIPDLTDLPQLPEGWVWASLDMLGEIASGIAKGTKRAAAAPTREVPYLRVANVQRGYLDLTHVKTIEATETDITDLRLERGDVLFNEGGDLDKLGRGWVWHGELAECIHQNHVFRMRPSLSAPPSEFISHHGNSFGQEWFKKAGKQTTNLASINMSMLRAFPVPVPPESEVTEIVARLDLLLNAAAEQENSIERGLMMADAKRKNLFKAAFAGRLVLQNPNDEPSSVLLERIRVAREERSKQPRTRKPKERTETTTVMSRLIDVLAEASDWVPAQEAFRRCGVADGALTENLEELYAELRKLDKTGRLAVEAVTDAQGRKLYDKLKLLAA